MADDGFWPGRRVLVTGATGFVGAWVVKALVARGADVVALVRDARPDSLFFTDKLYQRVHVVRGRADDPARMRSLFATYEIDTGFPLAAGPDGSSLSLTKTFIASAPIDCRIVVPMKPGLVPRVTSAAGPTVTFARTPYLFGAGDVRSDRWPVRLFAAAAKGQMLPPVERAEYQAASVAAEAFLDIAEKSKELHVTINHLFTAAELLAAVKSPTVGPVAETLDWYRTADLPDVPALRRAA